MSIIQKVLTLVIFLGVIITFTLTFTAQASTEGGEQNKAIWVRTCVYDGNNNLIQKICEDGGSSKCVCPLA